MTKFVEMLSSKNINENKNDEDNLEEMGLKKYKTKGPTEFYKEEVKKSHILKNKIKEQ